MNQTFALESQVKVKMWFVSRPDTKTVYYSLLPFCEEQPKPLPVEWGPSFTPHMNFTFHHQNTLALLRTLNDLNDVTADFAKSQQNNKMKKQNFFILSSLYLMGEAV